jgi:hypothetical protein
MKSLAYFAGVKIGLFASFKPLRNVKVFASVLKPV